MSILHIQGILLSIVTIFTGINPYFVLKCFRTICGFIAKSLVVVHPIRIPGIQFERPRIIQTPIIREQERMIEYIYSPLESYRVNEFWHIVSDDLGKWHIGLVFEIVDDYNDIILCVDVLMKSTTFFAFPLRSAKKYVIDVVEDSTDDDVVILASDLQYNIRINGVYDLPDSRLVVKTYWIRIIQRRWKSVYAEKTKRWKLRGGLKPQRQFELSGNYGIRRICGVRGLLSTLPVKSKQI